MTNLTYTITSGFPNFNVHLEPQLVDDQVQTSTGTFTMNNIPDGTYTLTITDVYDCVFTISNIVINGSFSTTTTTSTTLSITTTTTTTVCDKYMILYDLGFPITFIGYFVTNLVSTTYPSGYVVSDTLQHAIDSINFTDITSITKQKVVSADYIVGQTVYANPDITDCVVMSDGYYPSWNSVLTNQPIYNIYHIVNGIIVDITYKQSCTGLLYNAYAAQSFEIISGWKVPALSDWQILIATLGTDYSVTHNNALKETGVIHWNSPNIGATNTTNFYAFGGGYRDNLGTFAGIRDYGYWHTLDSGTATYISMSASDYLINNSTANEKFGFSIRLIKNNSINTGTVTDYDGNIYTTVTIGSQVWMVENLKTQHFSDGTVIPYLSNASDWSSTTFPALCPYNNDWINNSCTTQIKPSITTTTTTTPNINYQCHVLYIDASGYLWEYLTPDGSNTTVSVIYSGLDLNSFDIAMTANKLWTYNLTPGGTNSFFEYNISFNPWSISSSRTITYTIPSNGLAPKGLCAINNTTLIVGGVYSSTGAYGDIYSIYQLDITTATASATKLFDIYAGFNVGDILYLSSRNTFIIAYYNNATSDLRIGEFSTIGLALHEVVIPNYPTGLYLYNNNVYTIDSSGTVYLFDIVNYTYTYKTIIPNNLGIIGADSACFSNLSFPTTTTTTTTPITTTTTTTVNISPIACGTLQAVYNTDGYPSILTYTLGTDYGVVHLSADASVTALFSDEWPTCLVVYFDNKIVINTTWNSYDMSYDFGGSNRILFKNTLTGKFDPSVTNYTTLPNFTLYPDDGFPRLVPAFWVNYLSFYKNTTNTTAKVYIYSLTNTSTSNVPFSFGGKYIITSYLTCPAPKTLNIGDSYGGGYVSYLLSSGDGYTLGSLGSYDTNYYKGIIVSNIDQGINVTWWNGVYTNVGTGAQTPYWHPGYGSNNTTSIISSQGNIGSYAAKLCRDYNGGGYSDWFLPTLDELNLVWLTSSLNDGPVLSLTPYVSYWTSNEWDADSHQAWGQYFGPISGQKFNIGQTLGVRYKLPKNVTKVGSNTPYTFYDNNGIINPSCNVRACRYFSILKTDLYSLNSFYVQSSSGGVISTQYSGVAFIIKLTAIDAIGDIVNYNGTVDISSNGPLYGGNFTTGSFINGFLSISITFDITANGNYNITATKTGGSNIGISNTFSVINTIN